MTNYLLPFAKKYSANYEGLSKTCWQGIVLMGINTFTIGICFFLSLYFVNTQHFTIAMSGLLLSSYGLGTVTGGLITGKCTDKFSPKLIAILSLVAQAIAFFLLTLLKSTVALIPNLFLLGFAAYGFKTSNNVWMLAMCADDANLRYRTISVSHVAANFGLGISGVFIGSMEKYGFQSIFYLSGTLLISSAIYLFFQKNAGPIHSLPTNQQANNKHAKAGQIVILILNCVFLVGLIIAQLGSTYPIFIQELFPHTGFKAVSTLFILDTFLIVFFQAPLTTMVSKNNKLLVTGSGAFLMGLGMLVLSFSSVFYLAIISCIIWTTGEMLFISTAQLLCYECSNTNNKGQSLGLFQTTFAVSNVFGPVFGGLVYQHCGGNILWYISMVIGVFCFLLCWYFSGSYAYTSSQKGSISSE